MWNPLMILILEHNDDRLREFRAAASTVAPDLEVRVWRGAPAMIADLVDCLEQAAIISLDHDLICRSADAEDPGTGYDVAKLLSELIPVCPVIIHTSNAERRTKEWSQMPACGNRRTMALLLRTRNLARGVGLLERGDMSVFQNELEYRIRELLEPEAGSLHRDQSKDFGARRDLH